MAFTPARSEVTFKPMASQRKIGLTGGIASGKTTVARYLATAHQLPILDADCYARDAVVPGSPIWHRVVDRYGTGILQPNLPSPAPLDRAQLGQIVFQEPQERRWLEQQIHPYVSDRFDQAIAAQADAPTVVLVIPLLFEARLSDRVTEIWVVACHPQQQRDRLMARNDLSAADANARIAAQMPLAEKSALADVVLDNSQTQAHLIAQIEQALKQSEQKISERDD